MRRQRAFVEKSPHNNRRGSTITCFFTSTSTTTVRHGKSVTFSFDRVTIYSFIFVANPEPAAYEQYRNCFIQMKRWAFDQA